MPAPRGRQDHHRLINPVLIILGDTLFDADLNVIPASEPGSPFPNTTIIPPCVIGKNCSIENSTVGPNETLGDNCTIVNSKVENSIMWDGETVRDCETADQIIATEEPLYLWAARHWNCPRQGSNTCHRMIRKL